MSGNVLPRSLAAALAAAAVVAGPAAGHGETLTALTCTLESKHISMSVPGSWGGVEQGNSITLTYTNIDLEKQTARLAQSPGAGEIRVLRAPGAITFLETTAAGGVSATTVLTGTSDFPDRSLNAVHSRHVVTSDGELIVAQYVGFCDRDP